MQSRRVWLPESSRDRSRSATVLPGTVVAEPGGRPLGPADSRGRHRPRGRLDARLSWRLAADRVTLGRNVLRRRDGRRRGGDATRDAAATGLRDARRSASTSTSRSAPTRCDYCAFATWTDRAHLVGAYLDAVRTEISRAVDAGMPAGDQRVRRRRDADAACRPTSWRRCCGRIPLAAGAEVTVECNPDDVTVAMLETFAAAGVDRVSIGVQSMVPHVLAALGRTHDPGNVERAVAAVAFGRVADVQPRPDLRVGGGVGGRLAHDGRAGAGARSAARLGLRPHRRGRHARSPTTRLGSPTTTCRPTSTSSPTSCSTAAGLANYEVSNWARPGHECRHNLLYWSQQRLPRLRVRRPLAPSRAAVVERPHARALHRRRRAPAGRRRRRGRTLDADARRVEGLQLSLRTRAGVPARRARRRRARRARRAGRRPLGPHPPRPPAGQRGRRPPPLSSAPSFVSPRCHRAPQVVPSITRRSHVRRPRAHRGWIRPHDGSQRCTRCSTPKPRLSARSRRLVASGRSPPPGGQRS